METFYKSVFLRLRNTRVLIGEEGAGEEATTGVGDAGQVMVVPDNS